MKTLKTDYPNEEIEELISICKSNSEIMGKELRCAHRRLGELVGGMIISEDSDGPYVVVSLLRSACFFSEGIADRLDCTLLLLDDKHDIRWHEHDCTNDFIKEYKEILENHTIILSDAVINTGVTIKSIAETLSRVSKKVMLASNVIQSEFDPEGYAVYGTRISENRFKGSKVKVQSDGKGPDTGDRLFRTL